MSPLAEDIYLILRRRVPSDDGRLSYSNLVDTLPSIHEIHSPQDTRLRIALGEIVKACRDNGLPVLTALVVHRGEMREPKIPGNGYFTAAHPGITDEASRLVAWGEEWQKVQQTEYPESLI